MEQAEAYSSDIDAGNLEIGNDQYKGMVYFFEDSRAARDAVLAMDDSGLHPNIYVGVIGESGEIEWQPRNVNTEPTIENGAINME